MPRGTPALPRATGPPTAARPRHCYATRQLSVSPANERARQRTRRAGSVERCPPGYGSLGSRERRGSPGMEGFPLFPWAFPSRDVHLMPPVLDLHFLVNVFSGDGTLLSPLGISALHPRFFCSAVERSTLYASKSLLRAPRFQLFFYYVNSVFW